MTPEEIKEWIYKDLCYTSNSYYSSEQIYPMWENVYAIIVSGFFYVFFTSDDLTDMRRSIICIIGIVLSLGWFLVVRRCYFYSNIRSQKMHKLEKDLTTKMNYSVNQTLPKQDFECFKLFDMQDIIDEQDKKTFFKIGTWIIRKYTPLVLFIIWIILLTT
ncbi:MAG: hypothetical protein GX432_04460 [Candidatus Atribacteria bacterium]|nr:hypothetical protein [Candidatus Atribacteria bacterium]